MARAGPQQQRRKNKIILNDSYEFGALSEHMYYCGSYCCDFSVNSNKDTFSEISLISYSVMLKTC